jgi:hypothetical protein
VSVGLRGRWESPRTRPILRRPDLRVGRGRQTAKGIAGIGGPHSVMAPITTGYGFARIQSGLRTKWARNGHERGGAARLTMLPRPPHPAPKAARLACIPLASVPRIP